MAEQEMSEEKALNELAKIGNWLRPLEHAKEALRVAVQAKQIRLENERKNKVLEQGVAVERKKLEEVLEQGNKKISGQQNRVAELESEITGLVQRAQREARENQRRAAGAESAHQLLLEGQEADKKRRQQIDEAEQVQALKEADKKLNAVNREIADKEAVLGRLTAKIRDLQGEAANLRT